MSIISRWNGTSWEEIITSVSPSGLLNDIIDVTITNPTSGESLVYDSLTGIWVNQFVTGATGATGASSNVVINTIAPTNPVNGQFWVDIS